VLGLRRRVLRRRPLLESPPAEPPWRLGPTFRRHVAIRTAGIMINDTRPMKTETGSACSSAGNAYKTNNTGVDRTRTIARAGHRRPKPVAPKVQGIAF